MKPCKFKNQNNHWSQSIVSILAVNYSLFSGIIIANNRRIDALNPDKLIN